MGGVEPCRPVTDPKLLDLDRVPARRQRDRTASPLAGFVLADPDPRKSVEACGEKTGEIRLEGTDARLLGKALSAELIRLPKRLIDELGVSALEKIWPTLPLPDPRALTCRPRPAPLTNHATPH